MLLLLAEVGKPNFGVMETRGHPIHNWGRTSVTSSCGWITNTSAAFQYQRMEKSGLAKAHDADDWASFALPSNQEAASRR